MTLLTSCKFSFFRRRHSSGSSLVEALDAEEAQKLASCLDYILDIVGDTLPEIQSNNFTTFSLPPKSNFELSILQSKRQLSNVSSTQNPH